MKHRRSRPESDSPRDPTSEDPTARAVADDADAASDDGAPRVGPHHDPTVHTEREPYAVTTQRCRGEYP